MITTAEIGQAQESSLGIAHSYFDALAYYQKTMLLFCKLIILITKAKSINVFT